MNAHNYGYNAGNQRTQQVFTAGNFVDYSYDAIGQLKSAKGRESGGVTNRLPEQFGYAYDAAGNLNYRTNNALIQAFNVNSLNELTNVTRGGTLTVAGTTTSAATNVTVNTSNAVLYADWMFASTNHTLVDGTNTFTAIAKDSYGRVDTNTISTYLPASNLLGYDPNGNMTTNGTRLLEYDDENQLVSVTEPGQWQTGFAYDGKMRLRVRTEAVWQGGAWVTNELVRYLYDGILPVQERHYNPQLSTLNPQRTISYTRGRDLSGSFEGAGGIGGLLARTDHSLSSVLAHALYHADGNGNVTALLSTSGILLGRYIYDPYGNTLSVNGATAEANTMRFSSKEWHARAGLYYYGYRFYTPELQRWVNRDPIGESGYETLRSMPFFLNAGGQAYSFTRNNPNGFIDAYGLNPAVIVVGGLAVYGVVCNAIVYVQAKEMVKTLKNGECVTWTPRCLNLIALFTTFPGPLGVRACKDCNGKVKVDLVYFDKTGTFGGGHESPSA